MIEFLIGVVFGVCLAALWCFIRALKAGLIRDDRDPYMVDVWPVYAELDYYTNKTVTYYADGSEG